MSLFLFFNFKPSSNVATKKCLHPCFNKRLYILFAPKPYALAFIVGATMRFDLSFLNGELNLLEKKLIKKVDVIDSLEIARNKFPGVSNSLDALCKKFNIDLSRRTKHNALLDCELLREVYIHLLDAKEPKFNLSKIKFNGVFSNGYL